jgi:hypothetical protein
MEGVTDSRRGREVQRAWQFALLEKVGIERGRAGKVLRKLGRQCRGRASRRRRVIVRSSGNGC